MRKSDANFHLICEQEPHHLILILPLEKTLHNSNFTSSNQSAVGCQHMRPWLITERLRKQRGSTVGRHHHFINIIEIH